MVPESQRDKFANFIVRTQPVSTLCLFENIPLCEIKQLTAFDVAIVDRPQPKQNTNDIKSGSNLFKI